MLRPGGVFVASTFLNFTAPLGELLGSDELVRPLAGVRDETTFFCCLHIAYTSQPHSPTTRPPTARPPAPPPWDTQLEPTPAAYKWWEEQELRDLCASGEGEAG